MSSPDPVMNSYFVRYGDPCSTSLNSFLYLFSFRRLATITGSAENLEIGDRIQSTFRHRLLMVDFQPCLTSRNTARFTAKFRSCEYIVPESWWNPLTLWLRRSLLLWLGWHLGDRSYLKTYSFQQATGTSHRSRNPSQSTVCSSSKLRLSNPLVFFLRSVSVPVSFVDRQKREHFQFRIMDMPRSLDR